MEATRPTETEVMAGPRRGGPAPGRRVGLEGLQQLPLDLGLPSGRLVGAVISLMMNLIPGWAVLGQVPGTGQRVVLHEVEQQAGDLLAAGVAGVGAVLGAEVFAEPGQVVAL